MSKRLEGMEDRIRNQIFAGIPKGKWRRGNI